MDLKSTYDKIARDWARDHQQDTWWIEGTDKYISFLNPNAVILDVGCGAGEKAKYLIKKGFRVVGIDFSKEMIELAKEQVPEGDFYVRDMKQLLELGDFDGVFAQATLLHIPKKEIADVLSGITKPLKKNGYLYVAVKELRPGSKDEAMVRENDYGYDYERFFSYFELEELKGYIQKTKLDIVYENKTLSNNTNWIQIIAQKND